MTYLTDMGFKIDKKDKDLEKIDNGVESKLSKSQAELLKALEPPARSIEPLYSPRNSVKEELVKNSASTDKWNFKMFTTAIVSLLVATIVSVGSEIYAINASNESSSKFEALFIEQNRLSNELSSKLEAHIIEQNKLLETYIKQNEPINESLNKKTINTNSKIELITNKKSTTESEGQ